MDEKPKQNCDVSVEVNATWNISHDKVLNDAIYVEVDETFNLEDAISAETCVLLQKPNELDDQQLYISFRLPQGITSTGISVLSEARHVEVYNYNNEYITTIRSFLIEDNDDELKVYQSDAAFDPPMNEFKLKFMLRSKIEMWFYGALIKISNVHLPPTEVSFSDTASSQDNNGVQLEDVKNITTFLQATSSSLSVNKVFQMLDSRSRQLQEKSEDSLKSNNECTCQSHKLRDSSEEPNASNHLGNNRSNISTPLALTLIMSELENRLWTKLKLHLDAQEQRQTAILNRILALLEANKVSPG